MKIGAVMLAFNHVELSKRTVESIRCQDVPIDLFVVNNASQDETERWLQKDRIDHLASRVNLGISAGWNYGIDYQVARGCDFVLVVNNDVVLPRWFAAELASYDVPLITGFDVQTMEVLEQPLPRMGLVPYPDFSAYMVRKDTWQAVGMFDIRMFNYASDCDYHVRAHRLGLDFWKANVAYYHERSSTIEKGTPEEKKWMQEQGDKDRETFKSIYGCMPGTKEYLALLNLV